MPESVLFADDEAGIRAGMGIVLADAGFSPVLAADGAEALDLFRRHRPGIVITDIRMPGLDGIDTLRLLRERGDCTPVLLLPTSKAMAMPSRSSRARRPARTSA